MRPSISSLLVLLALVTCPATTMMSAPTLDKEPRGRGITRVRQLLGAGVNVAVGQDNMDDPYNPFGDADPMTNGLLTAYAAQLSTDDELRVLFDMISANGAKVLGKEEWGIAEGRPATFNIINARTLREAFRNRAERLFVIRNGRTIATTTVESRLYR
jgi:cytosine deaminase